MEMSGLQSGVDGTDQVLRMSWSAFSSRSSCALSSIPSSELEPSTLVASVLVALAELSVDDELRLRAFGKRYRGELPLPFWRDEVGDIWLLRRSAAVYEEAIVYWWWMRVRKRRCVLRDSPRL